MSFGVVLDQYDKEGNSFRCTSQHNRQEGGTQVVGGTKDCDLNITYNYSPFYREIFPVQYNQNGNGSVTMETTGLRWLTYKTGAEAIPILEHCVQRLGTKRSEDYWASILLEWAREFPDARFWVY
jgi:hypothetical protein